MLATDLTGPLGRRSDALVENHVHSAVVPRLRSESCLRPRRPAARPAIRSLVSGSPEAPSSDSNHMGAAMPAMSRRCVNNHVIDPDWKTCPYCETEQRAEPR